MGKDGETEYICAVEGCLRTWPFEDEAELVYCGIVPGGGGGFRAPPYEVVEDGCCGMSIPMKLLLPCSVLLLYQLARRRDAADAAAPLDPSISRGENGRVCKLASTPPQCSAVQRSAVQYSAAALALVPLRVTAGPHRAALPPRLAQRATP